MPRTSRVVAILCAAWSLACALILVGLIGARWLRYTPWTESPALDRLMSQLLIFDSQAFLWPWVYLQADLGPLVLALAIVVVGLHRRLPALLVRRVDGLWRLTPLAVAALLGTMLWLHYAFDLNPTIAIVCAAALALTALAQSPRIPRQGLLVAWGVFFALALGAAGDANDRITIVAWALVLLGTHLPLGTRMGARDLLLLRTAAVIPINLLAALLPVFVPLHGGVHLGDGLAYDFCELPERRTLYATVPVCGSVRARYEDCGGGRVLEYSLDGMRRVAAHNFFSRDFYGRLELIECLDDEVQVSVQAAVIRGRKPVQTALAFPVAAPNTFNPLVAGENMGITIAYDRAHAAVFYTGEFTHRIARYDRRTAELTEVHSDPLARRWIQPVTLRQYTGSSVLYTNSIHRGRNRIYLAEWLEGRHAWGIDLTTLDVVARYDVGGGGSLGVTVDEPRDRLFVSSVWGFEVFDLKTDRLIARRRTGLGNRPVIVDAGRNRLYLPSMVEGKIRILDRDTFDVIGQISMGMGGRFAHLSSDGKYLFASSASAHYYFDADALVPGS